MPDVLCTVAAVVGKQVSLKFRIDKWQKRQKTIQGDRKKENFIKYKYIKHGRK